MIKFRIHCRYRGIKTPFIDLSMENIQKQDGNALGVELLDYKKNCEKKSSTISKKDNAINDLEEKCLSLGRRVLSLEPENDCSK